MNPHVIRENLISHKGQRVLVKIYGLRNKTDSYIGTLKEIYPQIFTIEYGNLTRSYSYSELISGDVVLTFV